MQRKIKNEETLIILYKPNQRHELGFFKIWQVMIRNIIESRDLIIQIFKRDFLAGYKKTFLGWSWLIVSPLIGIISWVFMQKTGILNPGKIDIPYPVYVLIGTSMWGLFTSIITFSSATLSAGSDLIMQVNYPHEALLVKQIAQVLASFIISFAFIIAVMLLFGIFPSWEIIFFPIVIIPMFLLGLAIGLIVSMISVITVEINNVINVVLSVLLFTTPIIYSNNVENSFVLYMIKWNPLTHLICSARDILLYGRLYHTWGYIIVSTLSLLLFLFSWRTFYVSENKLVERMI